MEFITTKMLELTKYRTEHGTERWKAEHVAMKQLPSIVFHVVIVISFIFSRSRKVVTTEVVVDNTGLSTESSARIIICHNLLPLAIINRSRGDQSENRCPQVFRKPNSNWARSLEEPRDDCTNNSRERRGRLSGRRFQPTGESLELFFLTQSVTVPS